MVGTYLTGDGRYGPAPVRSGTHAGTDMNDPWGFSHSASRWLSPPHPGPTWAVPGGREGLFPVKPSRVAEARTMCPTHDGVERNSNVRSEIANDLASAEMLGICEGRYRL